MDAADTVSPDGIAAARDLIDPVFLDSPQFESDALSEWIGARIVVKLECLNPIRSFKGRGACVLANRHRERAPTPWLCASAGNFGQGLAYALRSSDIELIVYAAVTANAFKIARMRQLGADVRLEGADFDASKAACRELAERSGATFIEDGRDGSVTEGAGTIALELERIPEPLDAVVVPVGNGALINGVGTWFKGRSLPTRVIGAGAAGAPAMERSFRARSVVATESVSTRADGVATRVPVPEAVSTMVEVADDLLLVDDDAIEEAGKKIERELGVISEPAGAVPLAVVREHADRFAGKHVAVIVSGSNV